MHSEKTARLQTLTPNRWASSRVLETVHRLNARCLALLAEAAQETHAAQYSTGVFASRELWMRMDEPACRRAGTCPLFLLDLKFRDTAWWKRVSDPAAQRSAIACGLATERRFAEPLREALVEGWGIARSMPHLLTFPFGIAPAIAALIRELPLADLERILGWHGHCAGPRWPQNRKFWDMLLIAAVTTDEEALQRMRLYCVQLLGGEFLRTCH
jgi:hypothetical protein